MYVKVNRATDKKLKATDRHVSDPKRVHKMVVLKIAKISIATTSLLILVLSVIYISVCGFQLHETKANIYRYEIAIQQNESWANDVTKKCNTSDMSRRCERYYDDGYDNIREYCDCRQVWVRPAHYRYYIETYEIGNCTYDGQQVNPEQLNVLLEYDERIPYHMNKISMGVVSITCALLGLLAFKQRGFLTLLLILLSATMAFYHGMNAAEALEYDSITPKYKNFVFEDDCLPKESSQSIIYTSIPLIVLLLLQGFAAIFVLSADIRHLFKVETANLDNYNRLGEPENGRYRLYNVFFDLFEPLKTPKRLLDIGSVFMVLGLSSLVIILISCNKYICHYCATQHRLRLCNTEEQVPLLVYNALVVMLSLPFMGWKAKLGKSFDNKMAQKVCLGGWLLAAATLTFNIICIVIVTDHSDNMRFIPEHMILTLLISQTIWLVASMLYLGLFPVKQLFKVIILPLLGFLYHVCLLPCLTACIRPIAVKVINDLQLEQIIREERDKAALLVQSETVREEPQANTTENC